MTTDPATYSQQTFAANMAWLLKNAPHIHEKMEMVHNHPRRRKQLLYEPAAGGFCIVDEENRLLFDYDPDKKVHFQPEQHLRSRFRYDPKNRLSFESRAYFELCEMSYTEESPDTNPPKKIVFSGVGALHKTMLYLEKSDMETALFYEPDMELLYLSLYAIPYYRYARTKALFFLVDTKDETTLESFADTKFYYNPLIYKVAASSHYDHALHADLLTRLNKTLSSYIHNDIAKLLNVASHLKKGYPYLATYGQFKKEAMPVLLLSSGPSLDKEMAWVKAHRGSFIVAAVGSSLVRLFKAGITPDILFSADPKKSIVRQFEPLPKNYRNTPLFIAAEQSDPEVLDLFDRPIISDVPVSGTVNHFALEVLLDLGFKSIYTIGNDAALSESLEEYAQMVTSEKQKAKPNNMLQVKGNFRPAVITTTKLVAYLPEYVNIARKYHDAKLYNLSDGAYIEGFTPLRSEDLSSSLTPMDRIEIVQYRDMIEASLTHEYYFPIISRYLPLLKKIGIPTLPDAKKMGNFCQWQREKDQRLLSLLAPAKKEPKLHDWLKKLLYVLDVPTSILLAAPRFHDHIDVVAPLWLEAWSDMLDQYRSAIEKISIHNVHQPFFEKHMQLHTDRFNDSIFGVRRLRHTLTPLEKNLLAIMEKEVRYRVMDEEVRAKNRLFISLLKGDFMKGIEHFLHEVDDESRSAKRAKWLISLQKRVKGFYFTPKEERIVRQTIA